jgi:hypothetical protein
MLAIILYPYIVIGRLISKTMYGLICVSTVLQRSHFPESLYSHYLLSKGDNRRDNWSFQFCGIRIEEAISLFSFKCLATVSKIVLVKD